MNLESSSEKKYIKLDFKNKIKLKNDSDIKKETFILKTITEYFQKELSLNEINPLINKLIDKDNDNIFKSNKDLSKKYKKEFPFTQQDLYQSVRRILSSNYYPNFIFNKKNIEDVSRTLCYSYKSMKKYGINTEEKLKKKLVNITIEEKDIINMYIDFDLIKFLINAEKTEKINRKRNQLKSKFYANKNPKSFNSTGNLATIKEIQNEENIEINVEDNITTKNNKTNDDSNSSESDSDNNSEGVQKIFKKIKGIFDSSKKEKKEKKEINNNNINEIKDINDICNNKEEPLHLIQEYFIYPENNNTKIKFDLPIELIILLKKFEKIKILTLQIKGMNKKMLKENIFLLSNINLLFPNFEELIIDLNDDKLSGKINKIFTYRYEELLTQRKKDYKILKYNKNYQAKTTNCWIPEGDIIFTKYEDNKNINKINYIFDENIFEQSDLYGNKLSSIDEKDYPNIKYIIPPGQKAISFPRKEYISFDDLDESEEIENRQSVYSEFDNNNDSRISQKRISTTNLINNMKLNEVPKKQKSFEVELIVDTKKKTTARYLFSYVKKKKEPFEMIFLYGWFLDKIINIKTLSLYFNDCFSLETEFYLRDKDIFFDKFNFLLFSNKLKELNEINISFNSLDKNSFNQILGLINSNKNISILRINFFPPNSNFEITSLLKLCSLMKFSLHHLFREQKMAFVKEKEIKDLELDYFLLNHKFDKEFEKNISSLFNIIKNNIDKYKEIIFRFDLPLLIQSCDKYIILIIKFIINMIILISNTRNEINIFKIISPELILDGRKTSFFKLLFNNIDTFKGNNCLQEFILKCKIYRIPNLFNFCLYNNITNIKIISIGDMDFDSFSGFINIYKNNINKMINLKSLKMGLNNTIISLNEKVYDVLNEFININSNKLEEKILYSFLELNNDINKMDKLIKNVQKAKISKIIIQIGKNNIKLLDNIYKKQKNELEHLYLIMTKEKYKILIKKQILQNIKKFFSKHKTKIVICKPFFSNEF